jgi:hypothetical protein
MEIDRLEGWQGVTLDYQACGVLLAECGKQERYNAFCRADVERFRTSKNGDMAGRILKTCLLFPPEPARMEGLAPMARVAQAGFHPAGLQEAYQLCPVIYLAIWEYRRGDYTAVDDWIWRVLEGSGEQEALSTTVRIIQAMADYQRGRDEEAARLLAAARRAVAPVFDTDRLPTFQQGFWYDWLYARILLREAAGMIEAPTQPGNPVP